MKIHFRIRNHICSNASKRNWQGIEINTIVVAQGISGPVALKLSCFAAEYLYRTNYQAELLINWTGLNYAQVEQTITNKLALNNNKLIKNFNPLNLTNNLWEYLGEKALGKKLNNKVLAINQKDINRMTNTLCSDKYIIKGRYAEKTEFVSCGGIDIKGINPNTLGSKVIENLFFAGEALDIDAITGGFNLQNAWSTAYNVALSINKHYREKNI